jgi:hypothetical protein
MPFRRPQWAGVVGVICEVHHTFSRNKPPNQLFVAPGWHTRCGGALAMKIVASIEDIRAEFQRRINISTWGRGYCVGCPAPFPYRIVHDGVANWTAPVVTTKPGCEGFILEIIAATVRQGYDLPGQPLRGAIRDLLTSRKAPF